MTLVGIAVILIGIYALSFFQRKETDLAQSVWLGFRGMAFLVIAASLWITGFSMQAVALREVGPYNTEFSPTPLNIHIPHRAVLFGSGEAVKARGERLPKRLLQSQQPTRASGRHSAAMSYRS